MLADDEAVHIAHVHPGAVGDEIAKPAGVQHRSRTEDPPRRHVDRAGSGQGHHVDRVGDEDDHRVGGLLEQLRGELLGHRHIGGGQVQAALSGLLLGACGDDHDRRTGGDVDAVRTGHHAFRHELAAMVEVEHLGVHLLGRDVEECDRADRTTDHAGIGDRGTDAADPDDGHFVAVFRHLPNYPRPRLTLTGISPGPAEVG